MPRELADDDPQKWVYTPHTRAKHAIQWTYLGAWLPILGTHHDTLLLFDGFAGRGRYQQGEEGSPLLFWRRASEAVDRGRPSQVRIRCVEFNPTNFASLETEIEALSHPNVTITAEKATFADAANRVANKLLELGRKAQPTFWTADPYGFKGVPLETIRRLMSIPRSEVLITFMVRDMRRFLHQENFEAPLTEFFGDNSWRDCVADADADAEQREQCLLLRYSQLVRDGVAEFATPFRVFEDERRQTLYYLVHLSNHALGMRQMKKAMIKESPDMTFWPVTVRPPDQLELDTHEQPPFPRLQAHLAQSYSGQGMTFEDLLNRDYPVGFWLESDYRSAVLDMEKRDEAGVRRDRTTPSGQKPRGLKYEDDVRFASRPVPA